MKRKRLRIGLAATACLVALLILASFLVPGDELAAAAARDFADRTGADLDVDSAAFGFWPRPRVTLAEGTLTQPAVDGAPGLEVDFSDLDLNLGWGSLLRGEPVVTSFVVRGNRLAYLATEHPVHLTGFVLKGRGLVMGQQTGLAVLPPDLQVRCELTAEEVRIGEAEFQEAEAKATVAGGVLQAESITAAVGGGRLDGRAVVDYSADPRGRLEFHATCTGADAPALLDPWVQGLRGKLEGAVDVEAAGTCRLDNSESARSTLELEGRLSSQGGVLHAAAWLAEAGPYLGNRQDLVDVRFSQLEHSCHVRDGRYLIDLAIDGPDTRWSGSGWVGLQGDIDLGLKVALPAGFTPDLGQWSFMAGSLKDPDGRINLAFGLRGRTASPRVVLDLQGLLGGGSEAETPSVEKGWGGLLDKWKTR